MNTIPHLFETVSAKFASHPYLYEHNGKEYETITYKQSNKEVYTIAAALKAMGIEKDNKLSIISEGRKDWVLCELAMYYVRAVNVPLSVKLVEDEDLIFRLNHAEVQIVFTSQSQLARLRRIKEKLDKVQYFILFDQETELQENELLFSSFIKNGKTYQAQHGEEIDTLVEHCCEDDIANICYTSGTTADPKGILLTQLNYVSNVIQALSIIDGVDETYKSIFILPLDHSFAHTVGIYVMMHQGASISFVQTGKTSAETLRNIPKNIKEIQPTFLLSVPALAKNFAHKIADGVKARGVIVQTLFKLGLWSARKYVGNGNNRGKAGRWMYYPLFQLIDILLFKKIRNNFCKSLQFFVGGGALLDVELQYFFYAIGIPMYQGYGLTEASPIISSNAPNCYKIGSSGKVAQGIELKICNGEIIIRGQNVMKGYWKNEKATQEVLKNDWLHTGDMGYVDADGFLYVQGRFKSLLIANDGEKYSPEGIEEVFVELVPWVEQVVLYNNQSTYTSAIITPNILAIKSYMKKQELKMDNEENLQKILQELEKQIEQFKKEVIALNQFPQRWLPVAIAIANEIFSEKNGMINSTAKIVRPKVIRTFQPLINYLYTPEGKSINNKQNTENLLTLFEEFERN